MSFKHITLTPFQREKLTYYFNFFKPNAQKQLDENSLGQFMQRVLEFTRWDPQSADARGIYEVHEAFFEILFEMTAKGKNITLEDWMSVWTNLIPGCMGMQNFPVWLRLLPKTLFRMMDRDKDGHIAEEELYNFYHYMVKLPEKESRDNSHLAFAQMTDYGRYPLDMDSYGQIFSNFLLGRTPHGPGRHIFGCFEHSVSHTPFRIIKPSAEDDDVDMDIKTPQQKRPKRMTMV